MNKILIELNRYFWSVFGKFVWDDQNDKSKPSIQPECITNILLKRRHNAEETVFDAGCGTGNYSISLAQAGFRVIGADFAQGMIDKASEKVKGEPSNRISFCILDLNLPTLFADSHFDHLVAISVLQATNNPLYTLGEFRRILKDKGTLILSLPKQQSIIMQQSILKTIKYRIKNLNKRTFLKILLIIIKSFGDRFISVKRWTPEQSTMMLENSGFKVIQMIVKGQILNVAEKS